MPLEHGDLRLRKRAIAAKTISAPLYLKRDGFELFVRLNKGLAEKKAENACNKDSKRLTESFHQQFRFGHPEFIRSDGAVV